MPYQYDPLLDQNDPNKQNAPGGAGEQTQLAGGTQVTGGASDTQAQGTSSGAATHSDQFQNLNDYLNANQGSGFGNQFAGKIQGEVDNANSTQDNTANQFKQRADSGSTKFDADLTNKAVADPVGFQNDADSMAKFKAQRDANYTGPTTYADTPDLYQQASGAIQKAQDTTQAANSEGGRFALLDNYFGNSNYNQGQKSLDNLIVSGDQGAQSQIANAQQGANAAAQRFSQSQPGLSDYASQQKAATDATRQGVADAFTGTNGAIPTLQNSLNDQYNKALADQKNTYNDLTMSAHNANGAGGTSGTNLNDQELGLMGLHQGDSLYKIDPSQYVSQGMAPTLSSTTSADQLTRLKALDSLMGQNQSFIGDESQAGTYDPSKAVNFDTAGFNAARDKQIAQYQGALQGNFGAGGRVANGSIQDEINYYNQYVKPEINNGVVTTPSQIAADKAYEQSVLAKQKAINDQFGVNNTVNKSGIIAPQNPTPGVRRIPVGNY